MKLSPLPITATIDSYEAQAQALLAAFEAGDRAAAQQIHEGYPGWWQLSPQAFSQKQVGYPEAARTVAWYYSFDNWEALATWVTAVTQPGSETARFEQAADAVVSGDTALLATLLQANPSLIHTRSMRHHHAQLLHYVGANGIEGYRQQSPANAVAITRQLIAAGAEVDALADMYGGSTTLGLVATSIHPAQAGVLTPLLDALTAAGASIEHPQASGNGQLAVLGCLHNGRPEAADYLARHGARLDLEAAAGVGHLDKVQYYFNEQGQLQQGATRRQLELGFSWACAYGHSPVVQFLLDRGANPEAFTNGLSGLHWAIIGNHTAVIELLVGRGVSLSGRNHYGGNAIGCTLWAIGNSNDGYRWPARQTDHLWTIDYLLQQGAPVDAGTLSWIHHSSGFPPATVASLDELFRQYGGTG